MTKMRNKNKRGQVFLSIIFSVMYFMIFMVLINVSKDDANTARTNLDCSNSSISDGNKMTCLITDSSVPLFLLAALSVAFGILTERLLI